VGWGADGHQQSAAGSAARGLIGFGLLGERMGWRVTGLLVSHHVCQCVYLE
jgi:hypothetical protein